MCTVDLMSQNLVLFCQVVSCLPSGITQGTIDVSCVRHQLTFTKGVHSPNLVLILFVCSYCTLHYKFQCHKEFFNFLLAEVESTGLRDYCFHLCSIMASITNHLTRIPARQLNSKRIENSLRVNI